MDEDELRALLARVGWRAVPGPLAHTPPAWSALRADRTTAADRVAVATSWWPAGLLEGLPGRTPLLGGELVDVRLGLDRGGRRGRPRLFYVHHHPRYGVGLLVGGPPAGLHRMHPLVPEPMRTFFAEVHGEYGSGRSLQLARPREGEDLATLVDTPGLEGSAHWVWGEPAPDRPLPRTADVVVVAHQDPDWYLLGLHLDLPPGRAYRWWGDLVEVDLRSEAARLVEARMVWSSPPPAGTAEHDTATGTAVAGDGAGG